MRGVWGGGGRASLHPLSRAIWGEGRGKEEDTRPTNFTEWTARINGRMRYRTHFVPILFSVRSRVNGVVVAKNQGGKGAVNIHCSAAIGASVDGCKSADMGLTMLGGLYLCAQL